MHRVVGKLIKAVLFKYGSDLALIICQLLPIGLGPALTSKAIPQACVLCQKISRPDSFLQRRDVIAAEEQYSYE